MFDLLRHQKDLPGLLRLRLLAGKVEGMPDAALIRYRDLVTVFLKFLRSNDLPLEPGEINTEHIRSIIT